MSEAMSRTRYRGTPRPKAQWPIGKWFKRSTISGPWIEYATELFDYSLSPYIRLEKTSDQTNPGPPFRTGGPFNKIDVTLYPQDITANTNTYDSLDAVNPDGLGNLFRKYVGAIAPLWDCDPQSTNYSSDANIRTNVYTGTAYAPDFSSWSCKVDKALRPKLEKAGLSVAIAEAREIPQMLRQTAKVFHETWRDFGGHRTSPMMTPKKVSEDFLNYQFGWLPFIKDINDVLNVSIFGDQYIGELTARNNVWDHREATLSETETTTVLSPWTTGWQVYPVNSARMEALTTRYPGSSYYGRFALEKVVQTKIWCTGDYKFYRPEFDKSLADYGSLRNKISQYLILYGARINPSVLYKITPWTWLVDWFSNLGDVIESVTAAGQDGVVSQNLYTMARRTTLLRLSQEINWKTGPRTYVFERPQVSKQRIATGNPFGFCLPAALSDKQLAILAALGLSKRSMVSTH